MHRGIRGLLVAGVVLLGLLPAVASAAQHEIDVQYWPDSEPGELWVIVSSELPDDAELPVELTLPLMEGAEVAWVGELMGGPASEDIQREYEIVDAGEGKAVRFTLERGRAGQYEALLGPLVETGERVVASPRWSQIVASPKTSFSVRLPPGVSEVEIRPAPAMDPRRNELGEALYTLPDRALSVGDDVTIDISYRRGVVLPVSSSSKGLGSAGPLPWLAGALALASAALLFAWRGQARRNHG